MKKCLIMVLVLVTVSTSQGADMKEAESLQQAKASFAAGQYRRAVNAFEFATRQNPASWEAWHGVGMSYLKLGANDVMVNPELLQQSVTAFTKALDIDPNQPETRYQLGITYLALHQKQDATKQHDALVNLDKTLAQALSDQINAYKPVQQYRSMGETQPSGNSHPGTGGRQTGAQQTTKRFDGTVIMYGADWCPRCREAKQYMATKGIRFVYYNIEVDAAAKRDFDAYGGTGIPLIIVGNNKMRGFRAATLEYYLNQSR